MDVPICPRCGSIDLLRPTRALNSFSKNITIKGYQISNAYICQDCNYDGACPVIDEKDIKSFQEHLRSNKNNQSEERI